MIGDVHHMIQLLGPHTVSDVLGISQCVRHRFLLRVQQQSVEVGVNQLRPEAPKLRD